MKKIFLSLFLFFCLLVKAQVAQDIIAIQDFEPIPQTPEWTFTTPLFDTINGFVPVFPPIDSFPLGINNSHSWHMARSVNGTAAFTNPVEFANVLIAPIYDTVRFSFRLSSLSRVDSIRNTMGGTDNLDYVLVEYSLDNGVTYIPRMRIRGFGTAGAIWSFDAPGVAKLNHLPTNQVVFQPTAAGISTTEGYSYCEITFPGSIAQLRVRITPRSSASGDHWLIDNLTIIGEYDCPPVPVTGVINTAACDTFITPSGEILTSSGIYQDTVPSAIGCDSIITINLTINNSPNNNVTQSGDTLTAVTSGVSYQWLDCLNGNAPIPGATNQSFTSTVDGSYAVELTENTCTSTSSCFTINISNVDSINIDTALCYNDTLLINSVEYTSSGLYRDTVLTNDGLNDSIIYVINLIIQDTTSIAIDTTICEGQNITFNGQVYENDGVYLDTLRYAVTNCDSLYYSLILNVVAPDTINIDTTICAGENILINTISYNTTGSYFSALISNTNTCDSIHYLIELDVLTSSNVTIDTTICAEETFTFNGSTYSSDGTYLDTLTYTNSNCDSIRYTINLTVLSIDSALIDTTICAGDTFTLNGQNYLNSGTYFDTLVYNNFTCDSFLYTIQLNVLSPDTINIDTTICAGESILINAISYNTTGSYFSALTFNTNTCDSIHYLIELDVLASSNVTIDTTICAEETLTFNGSTFSSNGTYLDTLTYTNSNCDSIRYTINLTVLSIDSALIDTTICAGDTFTLNGQNYLNSGTYFDTLVYNNFTCDSFLYTIQLNVLSPDTINIDTTICAGESISFNGVNYSTSGLYRDTLSYINFNCDSVLFSLNLSINNVDTIEIDTSICSGQSILVNNVSYSSTGNFSDTLKYTNSLCDSIIYNIDLTVIPLDTFTLDTNICQGDSILINNVSYFNTGNYLDTLPYVSNSCDSLLIVLNLTVNPLPIVSANASPNDSLCINNLLTLTDNDAINVNYTWNNGVTSNAPFTPLTGLTQYILTGENQFACVQTDTIAIYGFESYESFDTFAVCNDTFFVLPSGDTAVIDGDYQSLFSTSSFACDSIINTNIRFIVDGSFEALLDTTVCSSFSLDLEIAAQNMTSFEWFVNDGSGFVSLVGNSSYIGASDAILTIMLDTMLNNFQYEVRMLDECGNAFSSSMTLEVNTPFSLVDNFPDQIFCLDEANIITLEYSGYDFEWSNGDFGSSISVNESGAYIVNFIDSNTNCLLADTVNVIVEDCIGNCIVELPTGFSPNNDGVNDFFRVITDCEKGFSSFRMSIFDRWGEQVFETTEVSDFWDGTFKEKARMIGTYSYLIEYVKVGKVETEIKKGTVSIIK